MTDKMLFEKDPYSPIHYAYEVGEVLCEGKTDFQEYSVITNPFFGRIMVLDGVVQLTERDEFFYHEMLVHVPLHAMADPKTVIIIGGGDGGAVREVVKHPGIEKIWVVDIDPEVTRLSLEYFPTVSSGLKDPRVELVHMDGAEFLKGFGGAAPAVDAVLVDSTDIVGFAKTLFTDEFFTNVNRALKPGGMFVTLSESLHFHYTIVRDVQKTLGRVFKHADLYTAPIATYAGNWWAFAVGYNHASCRQPVRPTITPTRYYCPDIHRAAFLPDFLYSRLMDETTTGF